MCHPFPLSKNIFFFFNNSWFACYFFLTIIDHGRYWGLCNRTAYSFYLFYIKHSFTVTHRISAKVGKSRLEVFCRRWGLYWSFLLKNPRFPPLPPPPPTYLLFIGRLADKRALERCQSCGRDIGRSHVRKQRYSLLTSLLTLPSLLM